MKKATVTIVFEQEKLRAVQFYMGKKETSLEAELDEFMDRLYEKFVPSQTREYIENLDGPADPPRLRTKRLPRTPTESSATVHEEGM